MIKAILWDLSGVLTEESPVNVDAFADRCGLTVPVWREVFDDFFERKKTWDQLERGELTLQEFCQNLIKVISLKGGSCTCQIAAAIWGDPDPFGAAKRVRSELFPLIRELRKRYRVYLSTNNIREWRPVWQQMIPVSELFEQVFDSSEIGVRKPELEYFAYVERQLVLAGPEILFIDDRLQNLRIANEVLSWQVLHFVDSKSLEGVLHSLLDSG